MRVTKLSFAIVALAMVAVAQNPIAADSPFQVRYAANLNLGDSFINITNTGANGAPLNGPGFGGAAGNICVNVYAFSPDEQLVSCCSCPVTPNGLVSLSVKNDLTSNTLTGVTPNSVVIKLVATGAGGTGGTGTSCSNSAALAGDAAHPIVSGLAAWGTTLHNAPAAAVHTTETAFTPATLSAGELASITNRCTNIIGNGSGFGICRSCRAGALGADKLQFTALTRKIQTGNSGDRVTRFPVRGVFFKSPAAP